MNLLLDAETASEPPPTATRSTGIAGLMLHAVLFTAIMAVQVGMVAQALAPQATPVAVNG